MKKISFLFLMMLMTAISSSVAFAGRYTMLKFTSNGGETYTIATNNLEILINDGNLTFNNTDLTLPLASLVSMEFTDYDDDPSNVNSLSFDHNGIVTVYNVNGILVGSFDSYSEAFNSLGRGVFVFKDTNGNTLKVSVGK